MAVSNTFSTAEVPGAYLEEVAPVARFTCDWSAAEGFASVYLAGDLDGCTSSQLKRALHEAQRYAPLVVLDLRELEFMDCAGVRAIVDAHEHAEQAGGRLAVVRGTHRIDRLFELTETGDVLELVDLSPDEPPARHFSNSRVGDGQGRPSPRFRDVTHHPLGQRPTWCPGKRL